MFFHKLSDFVTYTLGRVLEQAKIYLRVHHKLQKSGLLEQHSMHKYAYPPCNFSIPAYHTLRMKPFWRLNVILNHLLYLSLICHSQIIYQVLVKEDMSPFQTVNAIIII